MHKACIKEFIKDRNKKDGLTSACRECNNNREKKRKENGDNFTNEQKLAAFKKYGGYCQICKSTSNFDVNHKLPQKVCNSHTASNDDNTWVLLKVAILQKEHESK